MGFEIPVMKLGTLPAAADLTEKQYYLCTIGADGVDLADAAGEGPVYPLQNDPDDGETAELGVVGVFKVKAGAEIARGDLLATDANGKAVVAKKATTKTDDAGVAADPLVGSHVFGQALEAGVDGDIIGVLMTTSGAIPTTAA
jgi:hypothetical protein